MIKQLSGKGKEYGEISKGTEATFYQWIEAAGITVSEFDELMKNEPQKIDIKKDREQITVSIYTGGEMVSCPFVWSERGGIKLKAFWVDLLLLLTYIAGRNDDGKFLLVVQNFAQKHYKFR